MIELTDYEVSTARRRMIDTWELAVDLQKALVNEIADGLRTYDRNMLERWVIFRWSYDTRWDGKRVIEVDFAEGLEWPDVLSLLEQHQPVWHGKLKIDRFAPGEPFAVDIEDPPEKQTERKGQTDRLIELALGTSLELFLDENGEPCASIPIKDHREVCILNTRRFKWWLRGLLYKAEGKAPYHEALRGAVGLLSGMAAFAEDPVKHKLHNRVAWHDGALWYDLADERWRAIRIDAAGWQVVENPPNLFRRFKHQDPQIIPAQVSREDAARELERLQKYIPLAEHNMGILDTAYLGTTFIPDIAHPIPILHGPQGAGKSVRFRAQRSLVDPSQSPLCSLGRKEGDLIQMLDHNWTAFFDNVTYLPDWQQDLLCRACTGQGFAKRMLYTDNEDVIYSFKRCVGLNGINVVATRGDLLDRAIILGLERFNERKPEAELWAEFEQDKPYILGAIFTTLSGAMREDEGEANGIASLFRMADFASWAFRFTNALSGQGHAFVHTYGEHIKARSAIAIEAHPLGAAILGFMAHRERWEGSPSELLEELIKVATVEKIDTEAKLWPGSAVWLTRRLNEVKTDLEEVGIKAAYDRGEERTMTLSKESKGQ